MKDGETIPKPTNMTCNTTFVWNFEYRPGSNCTATVELWMAATGMRHLML